MLFSTLREFYCCVAFSLLKNTTLHVCNRYNDSEESVINFVKYRDRIDAVKNTLDVYENIAMRNKYRLKVAEIEANEWKTKRDNLRDSKKKMYVPCQEPDTGQR